MTDVTHACVAILLGGNLGAKVLLVVKSPCLCESTLAELIPSNGLLLVSNVGDRLWDVNCAGIILFDITLENTKEKFHHVIGGN